MKTIFVTPESEKEFAFLKELLDKLGYHTNVLYEEDQEDMTLLKSMLRNKKGEYASEDEIMKALNKK